MITAETSRHVRIHTPGRVCLFGDNCDLVEQPSIAMAISAHMTMDLSRRDDERIVVVSRDLNRTEIFSLGDPLRFNTPFKYVAGVHQRLARRTLSGYSLYITSTIPVGVGLASSAALLVGTIRGLSELFDLGFDTPEVAETAYVIERHDLMIVCGRTDPYAIAYPGLSYIETGIPPRVTPLDVKSCRYPRQESGEQTHTLPIVVGNTRISQDGDRDRRALQERLQSQQSEAAKAMARIIEVVEEGRAALLEGDGETVAALMNESQQLERRMQTTNDTTEEFCQAAINAGALGAKQTGGSGSIVAFCPGRQNEVAQALLALGGCAFILDVFSEAHEAARCGPE